MGFTDPRKVIGLRNIDLPCFKNHPEIAAFLDKTNLEVMESGQPKQLEEIAYDINGHLSIYLSHKVPLKDVNNNVIGLLGYSSKIDDIKAREAKLKTEKENIEGALTSIIANLPGHVYWKDKNGCYLGSNDKQANSLGFNTSDSLIGLIDFDLPWPEGSAAEFRKNDLEVITTGIPKVSEEKAIIDGKEATVLSQKVPLVKKSGEIYGIVGISLDITDSH